ncbi:hypothetical protein AJ79_04549 [Helicocarpus griseus UAMH5409]|uniref:Uncharacterized protein n=1 Tax=Helicocarpus griseus UAMH5409 TaxID=1447875 RepID=A0A2B7XTI6_9EURO|nr:hypothetical protein AJ79_04549 [Helicocarpus griseus UAMH5409]
MYYHTATQKFLVLLPQEQPAVRPQGVVSATQSTIGARQASSDDNVLTSTHPQKTTRSSSSSSTASTEMKSGFLRLGA